MTNLETYKTLESDYNASYHSVFQAFLSNISQSISKVEISSMTNAGTGWNWPPQTTSPVRNPGDWYQFFDPIYGICFSMKSLQNSLTRQKHNKPIDHIDIHVNIDEAFQVSPPDPIPPDPPPTPPPDDNYFYTDYPDSSSPATLDINYLPELFIFFYHPNSFVRTHEGVRIGRGEDKTFTLAQEIVDHSQVADSLDCETEEAYDEDQCLYQCLVNMFLEQFGCLHSRLSFLQGVNLPQGVGICGYQELAALTPGLSRQYLEAWKSAGNTTVSADSLEEVGWLQIQAWWADFKTNGQDQGANNRGKGVICQGCRQPCKKSVLKAMFWSVGFSSEKTNCARFQVITHSLSLSSLYVVFPSLGAGFNIAH